MSGLPEWRRLLGSGVSLTGGAVTQAAIGLVAQLILMRLLMPEDFGSFAITMATCSLVQMVLSLRLNVMIIRATDAELTAERCKRYRAALVWETVASAAVTLTWFALADLLTPFSLVLVLSLSLGQWTNQEVAFYERRMAYGRIVMVESGAQVFGHMLALALANIGAGAGALYVRELVVALLRLLSFARIGALAAPVWRMPTLAELRPLMTEARTLWLDGVLEGGIARVVILGAGLHGQYWVGIFAQSLRLATIPHQLAAPTLVRMGANMFSRLSDPLARRHLLRRLLTAALVALTAAALVAVALSGPVIPTVLGEHWRPAVPVFRAMAGVVVFFSCFELLRAYCVSQHLMRPVLMARLSQYAVFLTALGTVWLVALKDGDAIGLLALALSATYAVPFAILAMALRSAQARGQ